MSGVEAAGIVLAVIPLLVSACDEYAKGFRTMKKWLNYNRELKQLARTLDAERVIFRNTCENLLEGLVLPEELETLLNDPGGHGWSDRGLNTRLENRLQGSYRVYLEQIEEMTTAIHNVQHKLGLIENEKSISGDHHLLKKEYRQLKFALSHRQHTESLKQIEKTNAFLSNLTSNSKSLESSRKSHQLSQKQFRSIQGHANSLHSLIRGCWSCNCGSPHNVNLHLDARLSNLKEKPAPSFRYGEVMSSDPVKFKVVFSVKTITADETSWYWQETEIRVLEPERLKERSYAKPSLSPLSLGTSDTSNSGSVRLCETERCPSVNRKTASRVKKGVRFLTEPDNEELCTSLADQDVHSLSDLTQIDDLCYALRQSLANVVCTQQCLGYLYDKDLPPLGVFVTKSSINVLKQNRIKSLAEILTSNTAKPGQIIRGTMVGGLSRGDRLKLALNLASSVLQLYKTPWMREDLSKHDILIDESTNAYGDNVYVSGAFSTEAATRQVVQRQIMYNNIRNQTLFSLAILLMELCFGQALESLRSPEDPLNANGLPDVCTNWSTANRLLNSVYSEAGTRYGNATRRCIWCDFDERDPTLDNDAFRQNFYNGVIAPLEEDVKAFHGVTLNAMR